MKILVIGGTRGIGKALVQCGLDDNHQVTILARDPEKIDTGSGGPAVLAGDILDVDSLRAAVTGQDAVCSCIGVGITFKPVSVFSRGAANIVEVLGESGHIPYVTVTGVGAGETKGHGGFLYDSIFKPLFLKTIYEDKDREEDIIRESALRWLIVRPAGLTNGERTGNYRVVNQLDGVVAKRISRNDVADFILKQLENPTEFRKTPLLTY
jgi:putative NADH-flavin reductase